MAIFSLEISETATGQIVTTGNKVLKIKLKEYE